MKLLPKGAIAAAIGGSTALVSLYATPAFAAEQFTVPNPYPVPQSSPGVPNLSAVDITASGFTPGTFFFAQLCDGLPPSNPSWTPGADCGPATSNQKVPANGDLSFSGTDPNFAILLWHGSNGNDTLNGEQPFNCLAPDDNPNGTVTTEGNEPIDPSLAAWGSSQGGNLNNPTGFQGSAGSAPCQIRVSDSAASLDAAHDIFLPINLTAATGATPESPVTIALPIGAALLLGGGAAFALRRRRNHSAAA